MLERKLNVTCLFADASHWSAPGRFVRRSRNRELQRQLNARSDGNGHADADADADGPAGGATSIPSVAPETNTEKHILNASVAFPFVAGSVTRSFSGNAVPVPATVVVVGTTAYNYAPAGIPPNAPSTQPSPVSGTATVVAG